jgi:hypothetical protein
MEKVKEAKLIEAQNQKRKEQLASLSLLHGSLLSNSGDKGKISYQNRLRKIAMVEKSLCENPAFSEHTLVKTSIPFLYAKDCDLVVRKGDMLISHGKPYEVVSLNFKRREFTACLACKDTTEGSHTDKHITESINRLEADRTFVWFPKPGREERKMILAFHSESFYRVSDDGKLSITEDRYYYYNSDHRTKTLNPFTDEGMACIKAFALKGIEWMEVENWQKMKNYSNLFEDCIPDLAFLLKNILPEEDDYYVEVA